MSGGDEMAALAGGAIRQRVVDQVLKHQYDIAVSVLRQMPAEQRGVALPVVAALMVAGLWAGPFTRDQNIQPGAVDVQIARLKADL